QGALAGREGDERAEEWLSTLPTLPRQAADARPSSARRRIAARRSKGRRGANRADSAQRGTARRSLNGWRTWWEQSWTGARAEAAGTNRARTHIRARSPLSRAG